MRQVMVRYEVKPEQVEENEALVRAVVEELHRTAPDGLRYAAFKLDDGVSFVHLSMSEGGDRDSPLQSLPAFQAFRKNLRDRTVEGPVFNELDRVGSFRLVGDSRGR